MVCVLVLTSQPSRPRFPFEPGHGPTASQLLRGIENRGFKQIKNFCGDLLNIICKFIWAEKKLGVRCTLNCINEHSHEHSQPIFFKTSLHKYSKVF